jgi:hypothetical protein
LAATILALSGSSSGEEAVTPVQPVPFSHRLHASDLQLSCASCHPVKDPGFAAGLPSASGCMDCHAVVRSDSPAIATLRDHFERTESVPWVRIYRLPDFVYFSHRQHIRAAGVTCATCHGAVAQRDALFQEKAISMKSCMDCHRTMGASLECNVCHNPG